MFFKRLVLFLTLGGLVGCGLYTGEQSPKRPPPSYSGQGFSCVGRIPEHFDRYVNDQLSDGEISTFVQCLQKAFKTFAQLTRGRSATTYDPDEIRSFLHDFFLGERRISDQLLLEFMVLKQAILGGSAESVSRQELYVAVEILEELRVEAIKLKPHLKALNPRLAIKQDPRELGNLLIEANNALNSTIQVVAQRLQRNKRNYPLVNLQTLLTEFRIFVGWEKHFHQAIPAEKWVNFLRVFRQMTVAPSDSKVVRASDWAPMLQSFSRWYLVFLQYEVGIKNQPLLHGIGLQNAIQLVSEVFTLVEQSARRQEGFVITFEQMNEMTQALHDLRWIPERVRTSSIQTAMAGVVTRMLGNPATPAGQRSAEGLGLEAIMRARELFYRWSLVQVKLESHFGAKDKRTDHTLVPSIQGRPGLNADVRMKIKETRSSEWDEFMKLTTMMRPLFPDGDDRVRLVRESDLAANGAHHGFHNLSLMNLWRTAAALIFRGYAEQAESKLTWDSGITSREMQKFYEDFRNFGIDVKLVDVRNANTGSRAFIEGNLFTYSADGLILDEKSPKSRMNYIETMELFSFLYSGGEMAADMHESLLKLCPNGPLDTNQRPMISRRCVLDNLPALLDQFLINMPELREFLLKAPAETRQAYSRTLLETSFSPHFSVASWVEFNELCTLAVVLHYSEAVMTRYDVDRNGSLTNSEIDVAAGVFMGFIKKFAKEKMNQDLSDPQALGAFYYILTYREMPSGLSDIFWLSYVSTGDLNLNRNDLSMVFRVIIAKLFDTGVKAEPVVPALEPVAVPCQGFDFVLPENCGGF